MDKNDILGTGQIALGGYLGYKGVEHGLPRVFGIRTEYHTTSLDNAKSIQKAGNILDPKFGGKNGWSAKIKSDTYVSRSKNYVHVTGMHKTNTLFKEGSFLDKCTRPIYRTMQNLMYRTVGNGNLENFKKAAIEANNSTDNKTAIKSTFKVLKEMFASLFKKNNTKRFCIPGIDSYFNKEFIPDVDDIALKSSKPIKAYTNRFSAMVAGLKKFGLKGMKENKSRVAFGVGLMAFAAYYSCKYIKKGIDRINKQ